MPPELIVSIFQSPAGRIKVEYDEHYLYRAIFTVEDITKQTTSSLGTQIAEELDLYQQNPNHQFQLPLKPQGSTYQQRVWKALLVIPIGRTVTYGELATTLDTSPRAIGQACKKNPITLFIPCHRVIGKYDQGGYMGGTHALSYKISLLEHEKNRFC